MSHSEQEPILRTTPERFGKMLAILIGIMVVGGAIFFGNYAYWNSYLPTAGKEQEKLMSEPQGGTSVESDTKQGTPSSSGKTINVDLSFVESPDFKVYAFNSVSGPDKNPEIQANVGDTIKINVKNAGKSFHAFAITPAKNGTTPVIDDTTVGTADNPMKPGTSGEVTFVPSHGGTYYYICAVPGHRELGMEGIINVKGEGGAAGPAPSGATVAQTGNKVEESVTFVMSSDLSQYAFGALAGQPGHNPDIKVKSGDTVTIHVKNASKSFHAFGIVIDPSNPSDVLWNSAVATPDSPMKPGESKDVTFVAGAPGTYHYICTVPGHAALGMDANFIVEK